MDSTATQRKADYFCADLPVDNSTAPKYQTATIRGVRPNGGQDVMTTETRSIVQPAATQSFTYDDDGNLLNDGIWIYTWDAENRLVLMQTTANGNPPNSARKQIKFAYDYLGRRVQKVVSTWDGASYSNPITTKFIYDGWNLLAKLDSANNVIRSYMWGLDLSGTPQGAGGVGGLLAVTDSTGAHFPAYDGNGNIVALVKNDGTTSAQYEYGPFGETIRLTGTIAQNNPFRFSTKYTDNETSLLY